MTFGPENIGQENILSWKLTWSPGWCNNLAISLSFPGSQSFSGMKTGQPPYQNRSVHIGNLWLSIWFII